MMIAKKTYSGIITPNREIAHIGGDFVFMPSKFYDGTIEFINDYRGIWVRVIVFSIRIGETNFIVAYNKYQAFKFRFDYLEKDFSQDWSIVSRRVLTEKIGEII